MSHPALTQSVVAHLTDFARNASYGAGYYDYGVGRRYDPFQKKVLNRAAYREGYEACREYWNGPLHVAAARCRDRASGATNPVNKAGVATNGSRMGIAREQLRLG